MRLFFSFLVFISICPCLHAQITFPVNGVRNPVNQLILIKNAMLHPDTSNSSISGELLIRNGIIEEIGKIVHHPKEALEVDLQGMHVYPSFIEPLCDYGMPEAKRYVSNNATLSAKEGAFSWNEALRSETKASQLFNYKEEEANKYREAGYGIVQTHMPDGISRGSATVVSLNRANEHELIFIPESAHVLSFNKGSSAQEYPGSLMGSIALLRQSYLDGQLYQTAIKKKEVNFSIEEWNRLQALPQIFIAGSPLDILRIHAIAKEFNIQYIIKTAGNEYQRATEMTSVGSPFIVPLRFPTAYNIEDPYENLQIDLADLKHWEMAASNLAILAKHGIPFLLTSQELKHRSELLTNVRLALKRGLTESQALHALTMGPARYLNIQDKAGTLGIGKFANFIVTDGLLFTEKTNIKENWIQGTRFNFTKQNPNSAIAGEYQMLLDSINYILTITTKIDFIDIKLKATDSSKVTFSGKVSDRYFSGKLNRGNPQGQILFSTYLAGQDWEGKAQLENGTWIPISFKRISFLNKDISKKDSSVLAKTDAIGDVIYPFIAYGWKQKPIAKNYLIKNATVWTNEKEGILLATDVLIKNGKIVDIGKNLKAKDAILIDATNKHLTAGIIDEHSHIAVHGGVNECTETSTAEVRIGDVINSEDINIYRQLAGGVTTSHILHGSCNAIGGQTALIKLRWGFTPEEMKYKNADGFIKFALGENVKRSGGNNNNRFPDTRMGVEQVYIDAFSRARDYDVLRKTKPLETRRNLELDALAEILNGKRFITCHSYVQSEINMLMKVAEQFNFKVNTFTHILEGYKVADKLKKHGAGAAGFSDWWAYKFEVYEAIPYNGAILHDQGVVTAFNSDDAEMARRLNQEAAKAVMYGNVPEEEALKFVTLNPAKLLHIEGRVGSVKIGKDADLVLWNDHPLSMKASADFTFIDGIKFFDKEEDQKLRSEIQLERNRILQKLIKHKTAGETTENFNSKPKKLYHCDSVGE
ncbi:MAG: amidohydrolase family protein [Saprospiraceae bacterium]|nr:amidohydrolase family protein [Saprospiraceae bacterium]